MEGTGRPLLGTVTFLLTDVEGSSRLWEQDDHETVAAAVERHYEILGEVITRHRGTRPVEQGEGDSVVGAFARASDAVAAALDGQRRLATEPWATVEPVRVRMAVHSGEVHSLADGSYSGPTLNRCARLRELAHGGQILVSRATHDLVADHLADGVSLRDLGSHRLRDLGRAERVFQLCHSDLADGFPPVRSLDARPHNLPAQLTSFVGREREIAALCELLGTDRLVTLTGAGGVGKSRLALQVAAGVLDEFPDGTWWVDLAVLGDAGLVASAVATAAGVREVTGEPVVATLERVLADSRTLLVLDNCEHLVDGCAALCEALLRACPRLTVVATSREPLGVGGETIWRVPSLTVPSGGAVDDSEAVWLFVDRATRARPTFELGDDNTTAVAQICRRLDGVPLAIELAAARVRVASPQQIAAGLDDRFRLLAGGARTAMPRQRTLEASVDWSYDLLDEAQGMLFQRLSVFAGSFALESAEAVCAGDGLDAYRVFDLLAQLVDRSVVQVEESGRYRLLETIRQYGRQKLVDAGEADPVRARHLRHYVELFERAVPLIEAGGTVQWVRRLTLELDNVRAALDWAETSGQADEGLRLATAWPLYWPALRQMAEGKTRVERLLEEAGHERNVLAQALVALALLGGRQGIDFHAAETYGEQALALARDIDDGSLVARALLWLGTMHVHADPDRADDTLRQALDAARQAGDQWAEHQAMISLATSPGAHGDFAGAQRLLSEAAGAARATGDLYGLLRALNYLPMGPLLQGRPAQADPDLHEALELAESLGDEYYLPGVKVMIAFAATLRGDYEAARAPMEEQLQRTKKAGHAFHAGLMTPVFAALDLALGNADTALETAMDGIRMLQVAGFRGPHLSRCYVQAAHAALQRGELDEAVALAADAHRAAIAAAEHGEAFLVEAMVARRKGNHTGAEDPAREAVAHIGADWLVTADAFEALAGVLALVGNHDDAARFFGAAATVRAANGLARWPSLEDGYRADIAGVREALGDGAFAKAWEEGAALSAEEAVAYATRGRGQRRRPSTGWESLTPTELEVVRLVSAGLTNPQIGERLFMSRATVKTHLAHVFTKLGISTRAELAAEGTRRGVDRKVTPAGEESCA